ncbi:MAG TPA: hypothetical protein VHC69_15285 [Polyangiaceae bacterium]|nr:hypothetical protein [Polyangiaceae bacterium]
MACSTNLSRGLMLGCSLFGVALSGSVGAEQRPTDTTPMARPAATAAETRGVRVDSVTVPASAGARTRAALRAAVARALSDAKLDSPRVEYSLSVSLRELRRYVGPDDQKPELVCILDVALHDARGALVGSLSGRASGSATAPKATEEVLGAATRATLARLPEALKLADQARAASGPPKRRLARR